MTAATASKHAQNMPTRPLKHITCTSQSDALVLALLKLWAIMANWQAMMYPKSAFKRTEYSETAEESGGTPHPSHSAAEPSQNFLVKAWTLEVTVQAMGTPN
jgi:hypothetical protein